MCDLGSGIDALSGLSLGLEWWCRRFERRWRWGKLEESSELLVSLFLGEFIVEEEEGSKTIFDCCCFG